MSVLFTLAYRNLREHKTKTFIIGSIIALGMTILVVGNSILDTAAAGLETTYTSNFTGHLIISADSETSPTLTPQAAMQRESAPERIAGFEALADAVEKRSDVNMATPVITGTATAQIGSEGDGFVQYYAVDPEDYLSFFPESLEILEGRFLAADESGIVLSEASRDMLKKSAGREVSIGDSIVIASQNDVSGYKIREVPIVGICRYRDAGPDMQIISFLDTGNARILNGLTRNSGLTDSSEGIGAGLLGTGNEDELFGSSFLVEADIGEEDSTSTDYDSILGDTSARDRFSDVDASAWHYLLIKLRDPERLASTRASLDKEFRESSLPLKVFDWVDGAGTNAAMTFALKTVFNLLILVVAIVAVIIIMNTLVISVTERISEIGTMRALGARKAFVSRMILLETLMIAMVSGTVGIIVGTAATLIAGLTGIEATNQMLQVFLGGPELKPVVSIRSIQESFLAVLAAGAVASLYPAAIALRIKPVTAMK